MNAVAIKSSKLNAVIKTARPTPRPTTRLEGAGRVAVLFRGRWELYAVDSSGLEMFVKFAGGPDAFDALKWIQA